MQLMYLLERVRVACPNKFHKFLCSKDEVEYPLLKQLEKDGLIRLYLDDGNLTHWEPV